MNDRMMSYLKVYADFERATEALTEEEKGALLLAMLRYACGGEDHMETLGGGARILFPRFRMDIDHEEEIYLAKVNSGRKGGIAKRKTVESRLTEAKGSRRKQAKAKPAFQEHEQEQEQDQEEALCVQRRYGTASAFRAEVSKVFLPHGQTACR